MRARIPVLAGIASLPLIVAACSVMRSNPTPPGTVAITVDARCAGPRNTRVSVSPWNTQVRQGDDVNWVLDNRANADSIIITPKNPDTWLFDAPPPYVGKKNNPGQGRRMKNNARGRYSYNIGLICASGNNRDTIVIDPDIIVD